MKEQVYYFNKIPKSSEFNVSNYFSLLLIFIFLIIIYLIKYYPDMKSLLAIIIIFFYIGVGGRARLIKSILIKKIELTIKENKEILQKNPNYEGYLLTDTDFNRSFYKNEIKYFLIGGILFLILYGTAYILNIGEISSKYYLPYIYLCIWMTIFTFRRLEDIFDYFQRIMKICTNMMLNKKELSPLRKEMTHLTRYFQISQWHKFNKITLFLSFILVIVSSLFLISKPFYFLLIFCTGGIIFLLANTIYLSKQVNCFLPLLRSYDEIIKEKFGIIYKPKIIDKGYNDFADELNRDIKDIFR